MNRSTQSESAISSLQTKEEQTVFYYPPRVYSSERGNEILYFAPDQQVVVVVNLAGQDVLKAVEEGGTADEIALRLSRGDRELCGAGECRFSPNRKKRFLSACVFCVFLRLYQDCRNLSMFTKKACTFSNYLVYYM